MLNTGVMAILAFVFWIVVARFYTEAEVGLGSAIISAISLLNVGINRLSCASSQLLNHANYRHNRYRLCLAWCPSCGSYLYPCAQVIFIVGDYSLLRLINWYNELAMDDGTFGDTEKNYTSKGREQVLAKAWQGVGQ